MSKAVQITDKTYQILKAEANRRGIGVATLITLLSNEYPDEQPEPKPESPSATPPAKSRPSWLHTLITTIFKP